MEKSRFTDEQIIGFLKQVEAGAMLDIASLKVIARGKR